MLNMISASINPISTMAWPPLRTDKETFRHHTQSNPVGGWASADWLTINYERKHECSPDELETLSEII